MGNRRHIPREEKEKIISLAEHGKTREVALAAGVSENTVRRTVSTWRKKGLIVRDPVPRGRPTLLQQRELDFLAKRSREAPQPALNVLRDELRARFGVETSTSTIFRTLRRIGVLQQDPEKARRQEEQRQIDSLEAQAKKSLKVSDNDRRSLYWSQVNDCDTRSLVFVDETSCSTDFEEEDFEVSAESWVRARKEKICVYLAMSLDGILDMTISNCIGRRSQRNRANREDSNYVQSFLLRVINSMQSYPAPHSVLVLTPSKRHTTAVDFLRQSIESRGIKVVYLPPYAPELNPLFHAVHLVQLWAKQQNPSSMGETDMETVAHDTNDDTTTSGSSTLSPGFTSQSLSTREGFPGPSQYTPARQQLQQQHSYHQHTMIRETNCYTLHSTQFCHPNPTSCHSPASDILASPFSVHSPHSLTSFASLNLRSIEKQPLRYGSMYFDPKDRELNEWDHGADDQENSLLDSLCYITPEISTKWFLDIGYRV